MKDYPCNTGIILTDIGVPAPSASKILQRNAANTAYQWVDLPGGGGGPHASTHQDGGSDEVALDTSQITTGTLAIARVPTGSTSSTVCIGNDARLSDSRTPLSHTHPESDVTDLVSDLAGKSAVGHNHDAVYSALSHTHNASDINAGVMAQARLGSGSGGAGTKVLYDDQTYKVPGAGSTNIKETEIDFGTAAVGSKQFTITDVDVSTSSQILPRLSFKAATGRDADEAEMVAEDLHFIAQAGTGNFELYGAMARGVVEGKYIVNYLVG